MEIDKYKYICKKRSVIAVDEFLNIDEYKSTGDTLSNENIIELVKRKEFVDAEEWCLKRLHKVTQLLSVTF